LFLSLALNISAGIASIRKSTDVGSKLLSPIRHLLENIPKDYCSEERAEEETKTSTWETGPMRRNK
jgi:hypothetical protein